MPYNPKSIEPKWQRYWEERKMFRAEDGSPKPQRYVLDMFPYPSGDGLHVGHVEGYTATDIFSRFWRMRGENVLHPMGWDAFGLPAENYAIKTRTHPKIVVAQNVVRFRKQLDRLGFSYDWSRELNTTDPQYYRWTQWIFLQLFRKGLAYQAEMPVNFCPKDKTGLANEEVIDGKCERCGTPVQRRMLRQWLLKITAYADRLLEDLDLLDWPERIKEMQRNWIGRSEGLEIIFDIKDQNAKSKIASITVFTTRADTLFGATYVVLAPEHPFIKQIADSKWQIANRNEVLAYAERAKQKSELERQEAKEKTGVRLVGLVAVNPVNGQDMPVFVADYVLAYYGTGAVMAVPAHDERDFAFAKAQDLPVLEVVTLQGASQGELREAFTDDGILLDSGAFSGLRSAEARKRIAKVLVKEKKAVEKVHYRLRDWVFSRQRFWGEPIPLVFCEACKKRMESSNAKFLISKQNPKSKSKNPNTEFSDGELLNPGWIAVSEKELPVELPDVEHYEPTGTGESPLASIAQWVNTTCPRCGGPARRETDTMPQWAGSCWYYLRFLDPRNDTAFINPKKEQYWLAPAGVNMYVGGAEHAVLHLLYARFWHKVLYDLEYVSTSEPFAALVNQGLILGPDHQKMSKSRGNIINPDEVVEHYGADTLRLYEMFMGPLEAEKPWDTKGIVGLWRFLNKAYDAVTRMNANEKANQRESDNLERIRHKTIRKVTEDIEVMKFNTAIAALMEYLNEMTKSQFPISKKNCETLVLLLAPFTPHLSEELWQKLHGGEDLSSEALAKEESVHEQEWPKYDETKLETTEVIIAVQVNGKFRGQAVVRTGATEMEVRAVAESDHRVAAHLKGSEIERVVFVPDRLLNFVLRNRR